MAQKEVRKDIPTYLKFVFGGLSAMGATCVVHPMDVLKTQMQLSGVGSSKKEFNSSYQVFKDIISKEGYLGLYNGLSAGLLRQATYSTTRLGVYNALFSSLSAPDGAPPSFVMKALCGMAAGVVGAFVGTPAEVALVRMSGDSRLPPDQRRNYSSVVNALIRIVKEEGVTTLWRGAVATMTRGVVVNVAQLASYSQATEVLMKTGNFQQGILLHFCSSMFSGLVTTLTSLPVDIAKTRIQTMKIIDGKPEFKGIGDVIIKTSQTEGVLALWKGFTPYYARVGPHTVFMFIFLEQLNNAYKNYAYK